MKINGYSRIVIVGNNGSGKSYLTNEISKITGLPLIHLDALFWKPNWDQLTRKEWIEKQVSITSKSQWIIDGNHRSTMDIRVKSADLIVFIDVNRFTCLYSVFRRHGTKRPDMPEYLTERVDINYFRFLKGLLDFPKKGRSEIMEVIRRYPEKKMIIIKGRREMDRLLNEWISELVRE